MGIQICILGLSLVTTAPSSCWFLRTSQKSWFPLWLLPASQLNISNCTILLLCSLSLCLENVTMWLKSCPHRGQMKIFPLVLSSVTASSKALLRFDGASEISDPESQLSLGFLGAAFKIWAVPKISRMLRVIFTLFNSSVLLQRCLYLVNILFEVWKCPSIVTWHPCLVLQSAVSPPSPQACCSHPEEP